MIRFATLTSILVGSLALAGCGNSGNSAATDSDSPQAVTAGEASGGQCKAYIAAIRKVCVDSITRGLDMSCNNQLIGLDVVQGQAAGNLFDVGSDEANAKVVENVCGRYLESLRDDRKEEDAAMRPKGSAGPKCTALAAHFDSTCLARLGQEPLPTQCKSATRMMTMTKSMHSTSIEDRCETVDEMLSRDGS